MTRHRLRGVSQTATSINRPQRAVPIRPQILPFCDEWQSSVEALEYSIFPEYQDASISWRPGHQLDEPEQAALRLVAVNSARDVVGYGAIRETGPKRYRLNLLVDPALQGQGIGSRLYERLELELRAHRALSINARARDDQSLALDFLAQRGFDEVHRMKGMTLRVDQLAPACLEPYLLNFEREDVKVDLLETMRKRDRDWREKLYVLYGRVREGWPEFDPTQPEEKVWPLEHFDRYLGQLINAGPTWIAHYGDFYIGFVGALGTAVHPDWRRRGLGTSLKAYQAIKTHEAGEPTLSSNSANPWIWRINRRIGYQSWYAEVRLIKRLS